MDSILRAAAVYVFLLVVVRVAGKRPTVLGRIVDRRLDRAPRLDQPDLADEPPAVALAYQPGAVAERRPLADRSQQPDPDFLA